MGEQEQNEHEYYDPGQSAGQDQYQDNNGGKTSVIVDPSTRPNIGHGYKGGNMIQIDLEEDDDDAPDMF